MQPVKAFVFPLVLGLALAAAAQMPTCTRECCPNHFSVIQGFLGELQTLQKTTKTENATTFANHYDQQKAQTFLGLTAGAFQDAAKHFGELHDAANQKAATELAAMLTADQQKLETEKTPAAAQTDFNAVNLAIVLPTKVDAAPPAATPAK